jgi:uncharacterized membrane protein YdjX (TVP38/TMEM64 family)
MDRRPPDTPPTQGHSAKPEEPKAGARRLPAAPRRVGLLILMVGAVVAAHSLSLEALQEGLTRFAAEGGLAGRALFVAVYVAAALLFVPGSALTLAAGGLFGLLESLVLVSLASTATAALAFLIARHLARAPVERMARRYPRFRAVDRAIAEGGWRVVALLRLSPAVPFNISNYLFGLTGLRFWPYVVTSWAFMLPGTLLYVYLGHVGRAGLEAAAEGRTRTPAEWALLAVGLLATAAVTLYLARLARRRLAQRSAADRTKAGTNPHFRGIFPTGD